MPSQGCARRGVRRGPARRSDLMEMSADPAGGRSPRLSCRQWAGQNNRRSNLVRNFRNGSFTSGQPSLRVRCCSESGRRRNDVKAHRTNPLAQIPIEARGIRALSPAGFLPWRLSDDQAQGIAKVIIESEPGRRGPIAAILIRATPTYRRTIITELSEE